jgi:hypothetical protein
MIFDKLIHKTKKKNQYYSRKINNNSRNNKLNQSIPIIFPLNQSKI